MHIKKQTNKQNQPQLQQKQLHTQTSFKVLQKMLYVILGQTQGMGVPGKLLTLSEVLPSL